MNQLQITTNTNTTRKYEISGNGDYIFTNDTNIINNGRTIKVAFVGLTTSGSDTVELHCDFDEKEITSFEVIEKSSVLIINVQCNAVVSETPVKLKLTDVYKGSINPNKSVEPARSEIVFQPRCHTQPEPQPSIMAHQDWCGTCNRK